MKNILKLFIGLILFVMFSCHNITNSEQETLETNNHAYISISLNENARTVLPQSADFEKDFELSFELQGQQEGKDLHTIKKWTGTAEKTAYTLMTEDASVLINTGLWNFELSVQKAGQKVLFGTLEEITIQTGTNTLNFGTLQNITSGNGSVSVALSFAQEGRVQAVQGGLYNLDGTALEGFEKESLTITTSDKSVVRYNKENVPCGTYLVKFELFSDKEATKTMNVYTEIVHVATGFVSAAQRTLEQLNTLYTITYDLAGGEFVEGFTAQASFNQAMIVTLPTAENLLKTGYVFVGWKNDKGDTVTEIPVGTIGDVYLYAKWNEHTYSEDWTKDETHHWKAATCGHKDEVSDKAAHSFGDYVSNNDATTETDGTKTRECSVCGYEDTVTDEGSKIIVPEFVFVKGGTVVGAKNSNNFEGVFIEGRTVTLSDFYMGKYEVTQEEYASVMQGQKVTVNGTDYALESNPSYCTADSADFTLFSGDVQEKRPVEGVTWYDAVWYCNALSEKEGLTKAYNIEVTKVIQISGTTDYYIYRANVTLNKGATGYRLPTEAEWEYSARGGDPTAVDWNYTFSGADTAEGVAYDTTKNSGLDTVGWYCYNNITGTTENSNVTYKVEGRGTHEVGKKAANRLGLYDMSGNVREWCNDWYGTVSAGTESDPTGATTSGGGCVCRGGSWDRGAYSTSVSVRGSISDYAIDRYNNIGFRVVRPSSN